MQWFTVAPGSMGVVAVAIVLLGIENVNPGSWGTPVKVFTTSNDAYALQDILNDLERDTGRQPEITITPCP